MLIDSIKANQKARGWNATELARQLRISPSTWSRILTGERRIGLQFLRAAAKTFPELHWEIANYVIGNINLKGDNYADKGINKTLAEGGQNSSRGNGPKRQRRKVSKGS